MMRRFLPLLLIIALVLSGCYAELPSSDPTVTSTTASTVSSTAASTASDGSLTVHFIDVGQADCALIECDGAFMLIDGGNVEDGSLVVTYLENQGVAELSAVVCTHAHEDHVGGLPSVLAVYPTEAVYAPTRTYSSNCFDDFMYYADQQDLTVQIPSPGDAFQLGSADITILGPVKSYSDTNNTSIVLRIDYGTTSFLFTGDMETSAEADLLDSGANVRADVLKVGHHGSSTSSSYRFLYEVDPTYAVISVGTGNSYGHPNEEVVSRLADAGITSYRTDLLGTVVAVSDGETITFTWENQEKNPENTDESDIYYVGNTKSMKVHLPTCSALPSESNQILFETYEEATAAGYSPCSRCMG